MKRKKQVYQAPKGDRTLQLRALWVLLGVSFRQLSYMQEKAGKVLLGQQQDLKNQSQFGLDA
jgi:hypothetical protein